MSEPLASLVPGRAITVLLAGGARLDGTVVGTGGGWIHLATEGGGVLVNLAQAAAISLDGEGTVPTPVTAAGGGLPRPTSKERPRLVGGTAPGRPWQEADLRELADAYLDGATDADLASRFHRTRAQIKEMRQGFECARGNLAEDQIGDVARTWVERWRRVLL